MNGILALFQSLGWQELLVILAIVLILFGSSRLPDLGRAMAKSIREFRSGLKEGREEDKKADADKKTDQDGKANDNDAAKSADDRGPRDGK